MGRLTMKFVVAIGSATLFFSLFLVYEIFSITQKQVRQIVLQQASMALEFDLAIRKYVANEIRPIMYELAGEGRFMPETMSSSYIARAVFEEVRSKFPDYILKFSSDDPRNPANLAGAEELELIADFNRKPDMARWQGEISIDGKNYIGLFSAGRMEIDCLYCHGDPKDAPVDMVRKYGAEAGFHRPLGEIIGLDTVAIPVSRVSEMFWRGVQGKSFVTFISLFLFLAAIVVIIRLLVLDRVRVIAQHLTDAASQADYHSLKKLELAGNDEISGIAMGFNVLSRRLERMYSSLEEQVEERTAELDHKNRELKAEIAGRIEVLKNLEAQEATMRAIFRAAPTGIGMVNQRILHQVNDKLCEITGFTREELLGRSARMLYPDESEFDYVGIEKYRQITEKGSGTVETRWVNKSGEMLEILISSTPIDKNDLDMGVTFTALDITEQKAAARDRERLLERLARSQKMEALGLLAGGVAHDLNNVLSGIVSYPDLILLDLPDESPLRRPIQTIQESGKKAKVIVQDLLTLARRGVAYGEVLQLNDIIEDHLKSPEHHKVLEHFQDLVLVCDFEPELLYVKGSSVHLKKAIMNLLINAAEAIPGKGRVEILTRNLYLDRPLKGYDEVRKGDYVVLSVKDNGTGIEIEDLQHIFEPFYTKKVMGRSGTGLGMSVVWGTVLDHSGYIDVESIVGKGTAFDLYFPVTRDAFTVGDQVVDFRDYAGNGERILVVDDDRMQREIAEAMLRKLGYKVHLASCGEEGAEFIKNHPVDLVVLDMIMEPGIDGLETYKRMLQHCPAQKAIIASGYSETDRIREARRLGAAEYIRKPYTLQRIGMAVKESLLGE